MYFLYSKTRRRNMTCLVLYKRYIILNSQKRSSKIDKLPSNYALVKCLYNVTVMLTSKKRDVHRPRRGSRTKV